MKRRREDGRVFVRKKGPGVECCWWRCENAFGEKVDKIDWREREDTDITTCVN
jgi:hypothetical protein